MRKLIKLIVVLLSTIVILAGCNTNKSQSSTEVSISEESSTSSASSASEKISQETSQTNYTDPQKVLDAFVNAVNTNNIQLIDKLINPSINFDKTDRCDYLTKVKIKNYNFTVISEEAQQAVYSVVFDVSETGDTLLKKGQNSYIVNIGTPPYYTEGLYILSINRAENYTPMQQLYKDAVVNQIFGLRFLNITDPFLDASDIDIKQLTEFIVSYAAPKLTNGTEQGFTQEEMNAAARAYFGIDILDAKSTIYYNDATQRYMILGRGGSFLNERVVSINKNESSGLAYVYIEEYKDPLQLQINHIIKYTLQKKSNGIYQFISAETVSTVE